MKKSWAVAITLFFFLPLLGLGLASVWSPDYPYSLAENRALAQKPVFSRGELFSGRWTSDFDEYYTDQFPARERLMWLSRSAEQILYITLEGGSAVIEGDFNLDIAGTVAQSGDNLFLIIGDRIMHMPEYDPDNAALYAAFLGRVQNALPDRRVISMVVPNSFPFYAPGTYMTDARDQRRAIGELYASLDPRIITVDAYTALDAHKEEAIYFRTDHHWTARGAYHAYTAFCGALGIGPCDAGTWETGYYEGFIGGFYRQVQQHPHAAAADNPDTAEIFIPPTAYTAVVYSDASMSGGQGIAVVNADLPEDTANKYAAFTEGDHPLIRIRTAAGNGRSIAVVKESYANAFIPFLLAHYENIYVIDFRYFNREGQPALKLDSFVTEHGIEDVLVINYFSVPVKQDLTEWLGNLMD
jgi:hypothetical protein